MNHYFFYYFKFWILTVTNSNYVCLLRTNHWRIFGFRIKSWALPIHKFRKESSHPVHAQGWAWKCHNYTNNKYLLIQNKFDVFTTLTAIKRLHEITAAPKHDMPSFWHLYQLKVLSQWPFHAEISFGACTLRIIKKKVYTLTNIVSPLFIYF